MFDILIKNGQVIDGSGQKPKAQLDIAIEKGKIVEVSKELNNAKATKVIDATGQIITPGFIDVQNHSDAYWTLFDEPNQLSLLSQGITSIIMGNCGSSLAPLSSKESIKTIQKWHNLSGININWSTYDELFDLLAKQSLGVNVGSLIGHATLRRGLVGDQVRKATSDEIKIMDKLLRQGLDAGAYGLSMGLMYAHEVNSSTEELLSLAANLKSRGSYLSVHLRNESGQILEAVDEVIELAQRAEVNVKISHLKIRGKQNWHLEGAVINRLETAYHKGQKIIFDTYPYHTSWSVLYTYLPKWSYEGGREGILKNIVSSQNRRKILDYLKTQNYDYANITIASAEGNTGFVGRTLNEIAVSGNTSNEESLLNILVACGVQVVVFDHNLSDDQVDNFLASPLSIIATDGSGYGKKAYELVHPRCFGTMPRFLKWVRERNMITWENAIAKITSEPAKLLGLKDRGQIYKGAIADLVIFNPEIVTDTATYTHPYQLSTGINTVILNGKIGYENLQLRGSFGTTLRKT